jgi:hypothetical protein
MKDNEMRGLLLAKYYERRREQYIDLQPCDFADALTKQDILCVSQQLYEHGLIEWSAAQGNVGQIMAGRGHITASGVDIVENEGADAPIKITFDHSTHYSVHSSAGVQIGNGNAQGDSINLAQLIEAIETSTAPTKDKQEAKSRLKEFLKHPLVVAIVGKFIPGVDKLLTP